MAGEEAGSLCLENATKLLQANLTVGDFMISISIDTRNFRARQHRLINVLCGLMLACLSASATSQVQVESEAWMAGMEESLPAYFCQSDQYFMQCFNVTQDECTSVTKQETRRCLDELAEQIPAVLEMPHEGRKWGTDVGRCAGSAYDRVMAEQRRNEPRCNGPG